MGAFQKTPKRTKGETQIMKKTLSLLAGAALLLLASTQANADTFTFNDHWINWPGYDFGDNADVHGGGPHVEQMVITTDSNNIYLQSIQVLFAPNTERLTYDSLFINSFNENTNSSSWDDWDYFVHAGGNHSYNPAWVAGNLPGNGLYHVKQQPGGYNYTTTTRSRVGNPNGIDADSLNDMDLNFSPSYANDILTYDLSSYDINVSDGFFMAYAPWCANDVMGTPEPATMLLFGTGLIGLVGIGRRKMR